MLSNHRFAKAITAKATTVNALADTAATQTTARMIDVPSASSLMRKAAYGAIMLAGTWMIGAAGANAQTFNAPGADVSIPSAQSSDLLAADLLSADLLAGQQPQRIAAAPEEYRTLYVNPEIGSDRAAGREEEPLQTVTRALEIADPNTVIVLAPGRYNRSSGEVFPLQLKPGVTIQGEPGSRERSAIIEGGGTFESPTRSQQNAAILAADRAGIAQVAISNPEGYGVWVESASPTILETAFVGNRQTGIYVTDGSPRVQNNYFSGNQVAGLIVFGLSSASIASNTFDSTGDAIRIAEGATPEIVGNRMTNNNAGLVLIGNAAPVIRNNQVVGNRQNEVVQVSANVRENQPRVTESAGRSPIGQLAPSRDSKVPIPADAVPGELAGNLPILATARPYTRPVQTLAASEPISRPIVSNRPPSARLATAEIAPLEPAATNPAPIESAPIESAATESAPIEPLEATLTNAESMEPVTAADASSESIPDGSPGAALAALRSSVSLAPRAVTEENPDSPILQRRRDRLRREEMNREDIEQEEINTRREPVNAPIPINSNRLAVPSSQIPLGSGSSSTIFSPPTGGVGGPPAPPSRAQALGLYYRVFVEASSPFEQDEVREVIPDAFRTRVDGRTVMQVGAFPTEEEAEDRQRILENNGFNARIEYIR